MMFFSKNKDKAQASIEYVLVFSLSFIVLLPMIYMFYNYSTKSSEQIISSDLAVIGHDIVNAAESVYYMGCGSKLTLDETMPGTVTNITINSDWDKGINELVFEYNDGNQMAFFCNVNINGSFNATDYSKGLKHIKVQATNNSNYDYVLIDIY